MRKHLLGVFAKTWDGLDDKAVFKLALTDTFRYLKHTCDSGLLSKPLVSDTFVCGHICFKSLLYNLMALVVQLFFLVHEPLYI